MPGVKDSKLTKLEGWPQGIDNLSAETQLPIGQRGKDVVTGALRVAENINLDDAGKATSRDGYVLVVPMASGHSAWSAPQFPLLLAVEGDNLVAFDRNFSKTVLLVLASGAAPMSYAFAAGWVYFSNGTDYGRVDGDYTLQDWALQNPMGVPTLAANAAGGLYAGTYQVSITYLDADGRESGTFVREQIELAEGQGILLTDIPQPAGSDVVSIRVYASGPNASELYAVHDLPTGATQFLVGVHVPGRKLETEFEEPLPPGEIVRMHNGRMLLASNRVLYWSEALHYGQARMASNYMVFNDRITLVESSGEGAGAGLYVAAGERTYFLDGADTKDWKRRIVHVHGAVPGSSLMVDRHDLGREGSGEIPLWYDTDGQFVVGEGGGVQALHKGRYAGPTGVEWAATVLRAADGQRRIVAAMRGGTENEFAMSDKVEAEVWKDGVRLS